MNFNCDSIYEINPAFNKLYYSRFKNDLYIEDKYDNETKDTQVFCEKFSEKWLQIQNSSSESERRMLLCNFLKLESVFEFFINLFEEEKSIHLWNVALLFNKYNTEKYGTPKTVIYKSYVSFIDNVFNGCFNDTFEKTMLYKCDDECEPLMWLLPNGWLDCWCDALEDNKKDFCVTRYFDSDVVFAGEMVHPSATDADFLDFIKTEDYSDYISEKSKGKSLSTDNNDRIFTLWEQLKNGLVTEEDLSMKDLEKLCLIYENRIQNLNNKIISLREKLKHQIFDVLAMIFSEEFAIEKSQIHLGSSIRKDFELDEELEVEELFIAIEEKFKIETTEREIKESYLVEDLINLIINRQISAK